MNTVRALVLLIYLVGVSFVISAAILQLGLGMDSLTRCKTAIYLCLVFYVGGKVIIYIFLVERAHAIRASHYDRLQDRIWIAGMLIVLSGFGTIAVFAFLEPTYELSQVDGICRIGLPFRITLPLLIYDILMNLVMTVTFFVLLRPFMRNGMPSFAPVWTKREVRRVRRWLKMNTSSIDPAEGALDSRGILERLPWKSFLACIAILVSTVTNLSLLLYLRGREQGWLCFTVCACDGGSFRPWISTMLRRASVTWNVVVIHLLTSDPSEVDLTATSSSTTTTTTECARSSMRSIGSEERAAVLGRMWYMQ